MAKIKLTLTDEHIALIKNLNIQKLKSRELIVPQPEEIGELYSEAFPDSVETAVTARKVCKKVVNDIKSIQFDDYYGIDTYYMYVGSSNIFEQMALILGLQDHVVPESLEHPNGPWYDEETEKHLHELDEFMVTNLVNIEEILHQFCDVGIKAGTYTCKDYQHFWEYQETK